MAATIDTMRMPEFDMNDPEQHERADRLGEIRQAHFENAVLGVLSTPDGRFVFHTLLEAGGVGSTIFGGNSDATLYNAGMHDAAVSLRRTVQKVRPAAIVEMEREALERMIYFMAQADAAIGGLQ